MLIKCDDCLLLDEDEDELYCKLDYKIYDLYIRKKGGKRGEFEEHWQISFNCGLSEIRYYEAKGVTTKKPVHVGSAKLEYEESCGGFGTDEKPKMSKYYNKEG